MSLPPALFHVILSHSCPRCGWRRKGKGGWFRSIRNYTCESCRAEVGLTYDDKVKIFAEGQSTLQDAPPVRRASAPQSWKPLREPPTD